MLQNDKILDGVRTAIRETMCDDELQVEPSMKLMGDVFEESLEMIDLQFRIDKRFKFRMPGLTEFQAAETNDEGHFTEAGMRALRAIFPASLFERFADQTDRPTAKELWDAMTVEDLVNTIHMGIESKRSKQTA
jgi:hypothetical protein